MIKQTNITDLQQFCNTEPKTISQIAVFLKTDSNTVHNFFKTNKAKALFYLEKISGMLWIRTNPLNFLAKGLNLIFNKQNEKKPTKSNSKHYEEIGLIKRASPERLEAVLKLNRCKDFGFYNKQEGKFQYCNPIKQEVDTLFKDYLFRVKKESIVLTRGVSPTLATDIVIPYKTRFTSPERQKQNIEDFNIVWNTASKKHMKGVFLTLTANPNASPTLWKTNQITRDAWKRFSQFLDTCLPSRCKWVKVAEFQESGRLHYHIVIFGINWLKHYNVIKYAWTHYGGGSVIDIHAIRQDSKRGWIWARSSPLEANGDIPFSMLSKYLTKSMSIQAGSLYWAFGIRNWTASKTLMESIKKVKPIRASTKRYFLKGVVSALTGFRSSHRKDSIAFFSGSTEKPVKISKENVNIQKIESFSTTFKTAKQITMSYLSTFGSQGVD